MPLSEKFERLNVVFHIQEKKKDGNYFLGGFSILNKL